MKIIAKKFAWMSISCAVALLATTPAVADDTELLLVTPGKNSTPFNANILLIIDSSGSMTTLESTTAPYNSSVDYPGSCDANLLYWTAFDVVPVCNGEDEQVIDKASYVCKLSERQIAGVGLFSDVMVQYRSDGSGSARWTTLAAGNSSDIVECREDSGFHGIDGAGSGVYAQAGAGVDAYTSDPALEIAWGSYPTSESYTVYDGNYLNWRANPVVEQRSRLDIVKTSAKIALNSINSSNIGIMRFNSAEGGPVILGMTDLDGNRAAIDGVIDGIVAGGRTPLAETLYESALYWMGLPAHYGELINEHKTDPNALISLAPEIYKPPTSPVCTKNYTVLLTDGEPVDDLGAQLLAPTLPNFATKLGRTACTGTAQGDCLDDISEYLSIPDLDSQQQGDQFVTTHTIGFTIDLPILKTTAEVSGGNYYLADNVENLTLALLEIFDIANRQALSFTAPSVAVNTFNRTQNRNDLFMSVFSAESKTHWPGNLKKYSISGGTIVDSNGNDAVDPATGFFAETAMSYWTTGDPDGRNVKAGGAANLIPDPLTRSLFTNNGADNDLTGASNAISLANEAAFTLADFGLTGAIGEPTKLELIRWARGEDVRDEDFDPATTQRFAMGDPLHAQPAAIDYGQSVDSSDIVVYTATNDGYLHAFDGQTGVELWSFIPKELLDDLAKLYFDPDAQYKSYGIDGNVVPVVADRNENGVVDGDDFVYLLFGMRRGGDTYYALDVTDKNAPKLLWQKSLPEFGQTWAAPVVARIDIDDSGLNAEKAVAIIGGGYDPVHDRTKFPGTPDLEGAGVYMLDLPTGEVIWRAGPDSGADLQLTDMTRAIPNTLTVIDLDGDHFADRIYGADVGGQIWRFDVFPGQAPADAVTGGVIAQLGAEGIANPTFGETRRIYNSPDVALFEDPVERRRYLSVSIGTGYRAHPLNTTAEDVFYSLRDPNVFNRLDQVDYDNYVAATIGDFVEVSGTSQVTVQAPARGWKFTLPANEMILANSRTFDGKVFFVSFSPDSVALSDCQVRVGQNFLYGVSVVNGDPLVNNLDALADANADNARRQNLQQGGIAPTPTFLFPTADDPDCEGAACNPPPIGCVGVECFDPGFRNRPVRTLWTQDGIQ